MGLSCSQHALYLQNRHPHPKSLPAPSAAQKGKNEIMAFFLLNLKQAGATRPLYQLRIIVLLFKFWLHGPNLQYLFGNG
jgi:hypothetical protein